eukprot:2359173-Pyramimonas_sp.AAC.1
MSSKGNVQSTRARERSSVRFIQFEGLCAGRHLNVFIVFAKTGLAMHRRETGRSSNVFERKFHVATHPPPRARCPRRTPW